MLVLVGCTTFSQTVMPQVVTNTPSIAFTTTEEINTPTLSATPTPWQKNWLKGVPCQSPCWEGITPGETTLLQASDILKELPFVASDTIEMSISPDLGEISWGWRNGNTHLEGRAFSDGNSSRQIIHSVWLLFTDEITLQDVIDIYGEPTHVVARAGYNPVGGVTSMLQILYSAQGFGITGNVPTKIEPSLHLNSVFFFSPGIDNFAQLFPEYKSNPNLIVAWQGYQSFEFYCRDDYEGKACQGVK
jgi:hypothetical protein